jgi:tRNA-Thr(GGU) m(6)t(6)A37 methyltransferase TsaA
MEYTLQPIGVVRSSVAVGGQMPGEGVPASVEVFAAHSAGLTGIADNSYVTVVAWLHEADRDHLVGAPHKASEPRGVFATRSPGRPNPLGISTAKVERIEGNTIYLAALDFFDGTPVLDLKGPTRGWDYAWAASNFRDSLQVEDADERRTLGLLMKEAENFHDSHCAGLAQGVRMVYDAMRTFRVSARHPELKAIVGVDGCVADAVQALTGATLGNGRLRPSTATAFHLVRGDRRLSYFLHELGDRSPEEVLAADAASLFSVSEGPAEHEEETPALVSHLSGARREEALAALRGALVNGKLPCAMAYKLSREVGVGLRQLGQLANDEGIKISQCQLGCFR